MEGLIIDNTGKVHTDNPEELALQNWAKLSAGLEDEDEDEDECARI